MFDLDSTARDVLGPLGYEVLESKVSRSGRTPRVLIRIDRVDEATVSVEDVRIASEAIGLELDRLDPFTGAYHLEVESPGAERPLRTARHFERFHDLDVKVKTNDAAFRGKVVRTDGTSVTFLVDGIERSVPLADIASARLAEWPSEPR